jgi:hypothetical protein
MSAAKYAHGILQRLSLEEERAGERRQEREERGEGHHVPTGPGGCGGTRSGSGGEGQAAPPGHGRPTGKISFVLTYLEG